MLTDAERELWNDIERRYADEFERSRGVDPSAVLVVGARVAIVLILLGAVAAGLAVGGATGLAGLLWCYRFDGCGAVIASCSACGRRGSVISCCSLRIRSRCRSGRFSS